ncbi:MAG: hypothetical protein P8Y78_09210 [Acidihalobacter sp.]|jgi:hypothetical protein
MDLILHSPAAILSIIALVMLHAVGSFMIYRFIRYGRVARSETSS